MKVSFTTSVHDVKSGSGRYGGKPKMTDKAVQELFEKAFGIDVLKADYYSNFEVICSYEQFVKWQILRRDMGCISRFRCLDVKLVQNDKGPVHKFYAREHD